MNIILKKIKNTLIEKLKYKYLKNNVKLSRTSSVSKATSFEGYSKIGKKCKLQDSNIGIGTYIGENSILVKCSIGRFCSIGPSVKVIYGKHPLSNFVSTHPAFFSVRKQAGFTFVNEQKFNELSWADYKFNTSVIIGNDVWIGENVSIMEGITISDGAVIGANSLVTKDIEPYSINYGIPCKKIRSRFSQEYIEFLLEFQWWNKDFVWIKKNIDLFSNIEQFYKEFK